MLSFGEPVIRFLLREAGSGLLSEPMSDPNHPLAYCSAEVQAHDPERYLTSLFAADEDRGALHALYAFNLELARISSIVSEPLLGQVRLQWWREAIDGIYAGEPRKHEVVLALADAVRARHLPRRMLETMITGREAELEEGPPETEAALEAYLRATAGELVAAGLCAVGVADDDPLLDAGRSIGVASGYLTVIRALKTHAGRHRPMIPRAVFARHGLEPEYLAQGQAGGALASVIEEMTAAAGRHLEEARKAAVKPQSRHMAPLLTSALLPSYLSALKAAKYDIDSANFERGSLGRTLRVYRNAVFRKI